MKKTPTSLNFDDDLVREVPVTYKGNTYTLREPTAESSRKMQNMLTQNSVVNAQGDVIKVNNSGDMPPRMISNCLFTKDNTNVPENELLKWPARYIRDMMGIVTDWIKEQNEETTEASLQEEIRSLQEKLTALQGSRENHLEEMTAKN